MIDLAATDFARDFPRCPKCGRVDPDVRWQGPDAHAPLRVGNSGTYPSSTWYGEIPGHPEGEHFDLTCDRCGYRWFVE